MSQVQPGWYPDQLDSSALRYFDGQRWTEHTSPRAAAPAPNQANAEWAASKAAEAAKNPVAETGFWLSIVSLLINPFLLLSIAGIVLGIIGMTCAYAQPGQPGLGKAKAALIVGIIGMVLGAVVIGLFNR